nr:OmpA family protein [Pseudoalteromonas sp. bablab_jr010]
MSSSIAIKELETGLIQANTAAFAKQQSNPVTKAPKDDIRGSSDHPLLSRYPGSFIEDYEQIDYEEFSLPTGIFNGKNKALPAEDVTGDITRITYEIRKVSTLKVFHNYVSALTKEGFETVFSCERQACGDDRKAIQALGDHLSVKQVYNYYRQPRYQLMKNTIENQTTFVAFFVGNYQGTTRVQLVIIRTEPLQGDLVKTNPDQVLKQLEQKGKAAIYGIYFDHDKSDIKPESAESLKVIADVLNKNNSLNLYVVGHTDDKGSPEYNLGLSSKRAKAVVKALVSQYGIKESRLIGYGVGPYAPAANNKNDLGRQLNRRVELVERLSN